MEITTEKEYHDAIANISKVDFAAQKRELIKKGYTDEQAEDLLQPAKLLYKQQKYEIQKFRESRQETY
jgi:hypothetical protein